MPSSGLNLSSVNEAFGEKADLYTDVLAIRPNASTDQIQQAYFTRRDELFHVLAQMDQRGVDANSQKRYHVERQMDGVVMALRVLGDPDARMRYDSIRDDRIGDGALGTTPSLSYGQEDVPLGTGTSTSTASNDVPRRRKLKSALKKSKSLDETSPRSNLGELSVTIGNTRSIDFVETKEDDSESSEEGPLPAKNSPLRKTASLDDMSKKSTDSKNSKSSRGSKSSRKSSGSRESRRKVRTTTQPTKQASTKAKDDDEVSVGSAGTLGTTLSVVESRRSVFQVMKDEVMGALDDTSKSVEQVMSVFTLRDDEISAVFGRIDKAKRQMENEFTAA
eukprot:CAMPEP_0172449968 /NCGR_PEP_ID=MMETSP1065-20121228/8525_1 /TAXON_ID=265537 /ORGANISM="Amphiprora paludosa, Strain CCMP125" /LENGTH=333 /DNA_ID=CAMNT_0013201731 /DNA_START=204 /DNA_END=1205 /DNA_ORIENTATION=-